MDDVLVVAINLDEVMAASAGRPKGIRPEHLSKVWKIDLDDAARTLDVTTQHQEHSADCKIACNYGINNRMLHYRCLKA